MIVFILGLFVGAVVGWIAAHHQIAAECERLGGFFVNKKIYLVAEIIYTKEKR